jgi:drug/metabolite transporter (DMT)-like permease
MNQTLPLVLTLVSALLYVFGALLVKRSGDFGVGVWRTAFVSNLISSVIYQVLWPLGGTFHSELLWQPALLGALFLLAQLLNYLAIQRGDISVATPVLGLKIILVAIFTTLLLKLGVSAKLWGAAALSSFAIVLLNQTGGAKHHHVGSTILYAGLSATAFALFDVLVQKWSPAWGGGRLLPAMFWFVAVFNFIFVPFFRAPLTAIPRPAWPWLAGGCVVIGFQSMMFVMVVVKYHSATATNVIYSSRGLWSVVVIWAVGHWFGNRERHHGASVLKWRLAGASLMMLAILLVVM